MAVVIIWIALCFVAGAIASGKGRSAVGFFFLALLLSPLIGIIAAIVAKPDSRNVEEEQLREGTSKKCPYCAELIKEEAIVCRYCGRDVPSPPMRAVRPRLETVAKPAGIVSHSPAEKNKSFLAVFIPVSAVIAVLAFVAWVELNEEAKKYHDQLDKIHDSSEQTKQKLQEMDDEVKNAATAAASNPPIAPESEATTTALELPAPPSTGTPSQLAASPEPPGLNAQPAPESTPVLTVEEWKKKAIEQYPDLAVAGSPLTRLSLLGQVTALGGAWLQEPAAKVFTTGVMRATVPGNGWK